MSSDPPPELLTHGVRAAPRYRAFIAVGAGLGVIAALVLTMAFEAGPEYPRSTVFGYLAVLLGLVMGLVGGVVAVIVDRRSHPRRSDLAAPG
jgi:hypothetical protein